MQVIEKPRKLIRVRKEDVMYPPEQKEDQLHFCLDCWILVMDNDPDRDLGTQRMNLLSGDNDAYGRDPGEEDYRRRLEIGSATGAMIEGLSGIHRWAIYKLCSISTVWNFPNADLITVGEAAHDALREKLRRNMTTAVLF